MEMLKSEQLYAVAATDVCGVATFWAGVAKGGQPVEEI